jgi:hypothetical protein
MKIVVLALVLFLIGCDEGRVNQVHVKAAETKCQPYGGWFSIQTDQGGAKAYLQCVDGMKLLWEKSR